MGVTIDPNNPDVVYMPNIALYRTEDGGKTISIVRGAPGGDDYHQLWVDPKNSSRLILGTDQGTTISLTAGRRGQRGTTSRRRSFITSAPTTSFPTTSMARSRIRAPLPCPTAPIMARSPA